MPSAANALRLQAPTAAVGLLSFLSALTSSFFFFFFNPGAQKCQERQLRRGKLVHLCSSKLAD